MTALAIAKRLIAEERVSRGVKLPEARRIIAKEAGIAPGSLERLERGRLKHIDRIAGALHALLAKKIEAKIASLQHELFLAQTAGRASEVDVERAQACLEEARRAIGK